MIKQHDCVVLSANLPGEGLVAGDVGSKAVTVLTPGDLGISFEELSAVLASVEERPV